MKRDFSQISIDTKKWDMDEKAHGASDYGQGPLAGRLTGASLAFGRGWGARGRSSSSRQMPRCRRLGPVLPKRSSCVVRRSLGQTAMVTYERRPAMEGRWVPIKRVDLDVATPFEVLWFDRDKRFENQKLDGCKTTGIQSGNKRKRFQLLGLYFQN